MVGHLRRGKDLQDYRFGGSIDSKISVHLHVTCKSGGVVRLKSRQAKPKLDEPRIMMTSERDSFYIIPPGPPRDRTRTNISPAPSRAPEHGLTPSPRAAGRGSREKQGRPTPGHTHRRFSQHRKSSHTHARLLVTSHAKTHFKCAESMLWAPSAASQQGAKGARLSELSTRRFFAHDVGELAFLASSQRTP